MCSRNLLRKRQCFAETNEIYNAVLNLFYSEKDKELSMIYFINKINISKLELYDVFHELIEENIIGYNEYTRCPVCMNMQIVNVNSSLNQCSRCKNTYCNDYNIEKFYLKDMMYE